MQNPSAPDEVTWHYSVSATQASTKEGLEKTEPALLPKGVLDFYLDGHLYCETHVGGRVNSDTCTVELPRLGAHPVEVIYSAGALGDTKNRTDTISRYPTSIDLEAVSEPLPPRRRTFIDSRGESFQRTEVGQLRVTDVVTPAGYPEFDCEGQPKGCLIPLEGERKRDGSTYYPLYGWSAYNVTTGEVEWNVGFKAYEPIREKEEVITKRPSEQVGTEFFHVVAEPSPRYYVPSEATVSLDLTNAHPPFLRYFEGPSAGGAVEALETPMTKVMTIGTYDKVSGSEQYLLGELRLQGVYETSEGCEYEVRMDEVDRNQRIRSNYKTPYWERWYSFEGLSAGPHTATLWVGREPGTGPGECVIQYGHLELLERYG